MCAQPVFALAEGGNYIAAYGKAEAEYTAWLATSIRSGSRPTSDERRSKHKELFQDAERAYIGDMRGMQDKMYSMGKQYMRDLKNYNPPAPNLSQEDLLKKLQNPPADTDDKSDIKAMAGASGGARSVANANDKPIAAAPGVGEVKVGAAEAVTFKGANTLKSGDIAGAESVSFGSGGTGGAPGSFGKSAGAEGAETVSFGGPKPAPAPVAAPVTSFVPIRGLSGLEPLPEKKK